LSQGGTVVGSMVLTLCTDALTPLFLSEKNGSFSAPRGEVWTSYKTSKHSPLQQKLHLDSKKRVQHSPLCSIFPPHKLTANGTTGY